MPRDGNTHLFLPLFHCSTAKSTMAFHSIEYNHEAQRTQSAPSTEYLQSTDSMTVDTLLPWHMAVTVHPRYTTLTDNMIASLDYKAVGLPANRCETR